VRPGAGDLGGGAVACTKAARPSSSDDGLKSPLEISGSLPLGKAIALHQVVDVLLGVVEDAQGELLIDLAKDVSLRSKVQVDLKGAAVADVLPDYVPRVLPGRLWVRPELHFELLDRLVEENILDTPLSHCKLREGLTEVGIIEDSLKNINTAAESEDRAFGVELLEVLGGDKVAR